ncbi:hypothetical protein ACFOOK_28240 [Micromonospora krabiensis]|uniref:RecT family protein n=1 Tax=Micromonospora krabiensis TaxID=307121 RepID=A0A1C3N4M7_9ACTN|nr:hypothetical protein [Micromonospora krabiensis]SBV27540.1 hypothetical protein GA0070620_3064 [Micromonospora krabiensis]
MSDIAVRNDQHLAVPTGTEPATAQLVQWAQAAHAAHSLAEGICNTAVAPQAYRGKPAEAAAAILAGAEVGLSPIASLRAFDNIQGTPAPKAITLRAIAQGLGHDVRIDESTAERAVVSGRRKGDTEWQTSTWDLDRAAKLGLLGKTQWKQQPAAMLVARATAEVCRWIASDAIMGMPYTVEEIRDQGAVVESRPAPRLVSAADFIETPAEVPLAVAATDDAIAAGASAPWEPGEREELLAISEVLDEIRAADTQARLDEIKAVCREQGIRDQQVLDAWAARSAELVAEA